MTQRARMRAWLCGQGAVLAAVLACVGQGCGDSNGPGPANTPAPQPVCPTTPAETIGASCAVEGLQCGPLYTCGALSVALVCRCTRGVFACADGTGQPVQAVAELACPAPQPTGQCPASERAAQLAPCSEQGLLCPYTSSCPSMLDQCQCSAGTTATGGFGLRFECHPAICADAGTSTTNDGGSREAGTLDAAADTGARAEAGAGDSGDSAAPDAQGSDADAPPDAPPDVVTPDDGPSADAPSE